MSQKRAKFVPGKGAGSWVGGVSRLLVIKAVKGNSTEIPNFTLAKQ